MRDHLAGGIRHGDVDDVAVARHVADEQLQSEVVAGEHRGLGAGGEVLRDREAALAHLVGQRALLRAQQKAADEDTVTVSNEMIRTLSLSLSGNRTGRLPMIARPGDVP